MSTKQLIYSRGDDTEIVRGQFDARSRSVEENELSVKLKRWIGRQDYLPAHLHVNEQLPYIFVVEKQPGCQAEMKDEYSLVL